MKLQNRIKEYRLSHQPRLSSTKLGRLLTPPVTKNSVVGWEKNEWQPKKIYHTQLVEIFGTKQEELFYIDFSTDEATK